VTPAIPVRVLLRRGAAAVAAGRVAIGLAALASPSLPARPWVGAAADDLAASVFGRALGGRDLALGLGALEALRRPDGEASTWVAAGAISDALDVAASALAWQRLPRGWRWLVVGSAGAASCVGLAAAAYLRVRPLSTLPAAQSAAVHARVTPVP
jgi:hypothetical protein